MKYVINANPVDIQDRNGFRRYLSEQAQIGFQARWIWPTCTVFEKVDKPHRNYDILFAGDESKSYSGDIFKVNNGVVIIPDDAAVQWSSWWEDISGAYEQIFLYRRSTVRSRFIATLMRLIIPLIILVIAPYCLGVSSPSFVLFTDGEITAGMIAAVLTLFVYVVLKYLLDSMAEQIDRQHLAGIRQAVASGKIYCTPEEMKKVVLRKNRLQTWCAPLLVLALVICALVFL